MSDPIDLILASFRDLKDRSRNSLVEFWQIHKGQQTLALLSGLIKIDLQDRFQRGERPTAAEYFALFPELTADDDRALSLVYEEFCLLEENHVRPDISDFCARYEPWRDSIASQLAYHREFSQIVGAERPKVRYPGVGERFATYQLCSILGHGGAAQVYLATDDLGGRQVVLKVSPSVGREPSILASLEHRNIVPILTVAESPELGLRGICMPYKPGVTLEGMLEKSSSGSPHRKAAELWTSLGLDSIELEATEMGWKGFPLGGTYPEAVAWIGLAITNALVYLHEKKGIFHRDIKPANILLAHKEGPLLFDFNLAHTPNAPEEAQDALTGGTLPYMAPEQLRAFLDPSAWDDVGATADIYALGLVLRELITGQKPDLPNRALPLTRAIQDLLDRRLNLNASTRFDHPDVPPSLDAIIIKCLAFKASERYATARILSEDLRRFLERKPLVGVKNSSFEMTFNWLFRYRKLAAGIFLMALFMGLIITNRPNRMDQVFDPQKSAQFQKGSLLLKSADPAQWQEARKIFERLSKDYPRSAWPLVYQASSVLKLSVSKLVNREQAEDFLQTAWKQADADVAIKQRLTEEPRSASLNIALARVLEVNNPDLAREHLRRALEINPEHEGALVFLGNIERRQKNKPEAIKLYRKALQLAPSTEKTKKMITETRIVLIPILMIEIDRLLSDPISHLNRELAADYLEELDHQIAAMAGTRQGVMDPHRSTLAAGERQYCLGVLGSGRAYLSALREDKLQAVEQFRSAAHCFQLVVDTSRLSAQQKNPDEIKRANDQAAQARKGQAVLKQRMFKCRLSLVTIPESSAVASDLVEAPGTLQPAAR